MAKVQRVTAVTIETRAGSGTTGARKVRGAGKVPGALYGHGSPQAIAVEMRSLADLIATGGASHVVDATIDGKHESVLLREVQRNPITHKPISADFQRVSKTEAITTAIAVTTVGVAPGVKDGGGVMDIVTHAIEVKGPAGKLPEHFEIDVDTMNIHDHVAAGDIKLPAGFTLITPADTVVISIEPGRTAAEEAELTAVPVAAEDAASEAEPDAEAEPAAE